MKEFKNLIFDIGDVLIDLDFIATIGEFQKLTLVDFGEIISHFRQHKIFDRFETANPAAPARLVSVETRAGSRSVRRPRQRQIFGSARGLTDHRRRMVCREPPRRGRGASIP